MRPSSSTWRSSVLSAVLGLSIASAAQGYCLPPLFEGGRRLHDLQGSSLFDLDVTLRQHEICWRPQARPDETRVMLFGSSTLFGIPHPAEQTFWAHLNRWLEESGDEAHLYNLAYATTYQLKDAILIRESLRFRPDKMIYGLTLADFHHEAPILWPLIITGFLEENRDRIEALAEEGAPGLEEVVAVYVGSERARAGRSQLWLDVEHALRSLRAHGAYLRLATRAAARRLVKRWAVEEGTALLDERQHRKPLLRRGRYECEKVLEAYEKTHHGWQKWNVLAYLEEVSAREKLDVLIVSWPIEHSPRGACYNRRYPAAEVAVFNDWLRAEATKRGFSFVDLHDLLSPEQFVDSLHPTADGQLEIARRLQPVVAEFLSSENE